MFIIGDKPGPSKLANAENQESQLLYGMTY